MDAHKQIIKEVCCLACGHKFNRASSMDTTGKNEKLQAGDISLCLECGFIGIFADANGTIRRPTQDEIKEIMHSEQGEIIQLALKVIREKQEVK